MHKRILISGALFCLLAVVIGAFAAHALKSQLSEYSLDIFKTGVHYQMLHGIGLIFCGITYMHFSHNKIAQKWLNIASYHFTIGIVFFSGSLYGLALTSMTWIGPITPIGGLLMTVGWACYIWAIVKS
jgi:uncharacterized membrane protein YgdD (TMEM256/DUF423 family)